ncbi:Reticulon-like protein B16 [Dichanthelium oligosanthes]|uniref:Reticulon-like protein n=1 Tax=Dichanthelium oligosanthes TaxID=888268 RepID=A0A1E5V2I4_9POAL|nr:Reticulon-like protein B16 [Dichanthelium oligosanthes]
MDSAGGAEAAASGGIEGSADPCSSGGAGGCRLSVHQIAGGGKAADIILWRRGRVTFGVIFGATMAWLLFEKSGLSFLTICCDIFLILIIVQFIRVKIAGLLNRQPRPLPELVLSEEMVSNAAASFRVKVNNMLMIAHDITLGKDFRLFFQVVLVLWLLSVIGNFCSSITLAYIGMFCTYHTSDSLMPYTFRNIQYQGTIALVTIPALYDKYQGHVDRYAGMVHRNISRHYKIVDENVISRLPRRFIRDKED